MNDNSFNDFFFRMMDLSKHGFYCSQILILLGLEDQGKTNPDLVRAMGGLIGGLGFSGKNCGALTGGVCLLALYAGKGTAEEVEDSHLNRMIRELVEWFESEYGGIDCRNISRDNFQNRMIRCSQVVAKTYEKVKEILLANDYDLSGKLAEP